MRTIKPLCVALVLALALPASHGATNEALLTRLRKSYPNTTFDSVRRSEIPGLYEVWMGANVAYVSAAHTRYFLFGHLYDTRGGRDLTSARREVFPEPPSPQMPAAPSTTPAAVNLDALPLADAIKTVSGNGAAKLVVFTDPACPYCKRLDGELSRLSDITVYNFMVPFLGDALPLAIWCAPDRPRAWKDALGGTITPREERDCPNPIERNRQLAARLGIAGTPTIVLSTGARIDGYASADEIRRRLAAVPGTVSANTKE